MATPTAAGQAVIDQEGNIGITTDYPAKRTPTIAVQYIGHPYPVKAQLSELTVITVCEAK